MMAAWEGKRSLWVWICILCNCYVVLEMQENIGSVIQIKFLDIREYGE